MSRTAHRWGLAVPALLTLGCSGLFGDGVAEVDTVEGRATVEVPSPSASLARGFDGPAHRARVADALCAGEPQVWGGVEQGVRRSHEAGELHAEILRRYTGLTGRCHQPGYCRRARTKLAATDGEIKAFWLQVLASCGDLADRPLFRDYDAESSGVVAFYTAGEHPAHREGADDGALILAVERLVQRGGLDPALAGAIDALLRTDHPEAAERLAALVPEANLDVADHLLSALAGQSHEAAVAVVSAACARTDRIELCAPTAAPPPADHATTWLGELARAADPDRASALLEAHPELRERAAAHLSGCLATCAGPHSLVDGDNGYIQLVDAAGIDARPDRVGRATFDHSVDAVLEGRGRVVHLSLERSATEGHDRLGRALARIAAPHLDNAWFHEVQPTAEAPGLLALELDQRRFEIPLVDTPGMRDATAVVALVNRGLTERDAPLRIHRIETGWEHATFAALPQGVSLSLQSDGSLVLSPPE